ncbi:hypothetical protein [Kordiimonas sp.]|uniref:hypothetical protein n=1 Tax=Kordiimonas sp. TaxID=1970157 RepID=UPI003A8CAB06
MFDTAKVKVIAFDVFGTVFDFADVPREEVRDYADQLRRPEWSPLQLPKSWETMPAHSDSMAGVARLREIATVVTCSNGPLGLQAKMSKRAGIVWDAIIPLELNKVYKTDPRAYMTVCEVLDVAPENVLMVTANEKFGDLEASRALGMQAVLIRGDSEIQTILDLWDIFLLDLMEGKLQRQE